MRVTRRKLASRSYLRITDRGILLVELTLQAMKTLSELMDRALDLDATARTAWLAELDTGPNAKLRPYLADMLARQANMETAFLVNPVQLTGAATTSGNGHAVVKLAPGARVGPYQLQKEIGHGGMGAVWLAERIDGSMTRQVALKLPMMHLADMFAERFARERDILAQLTHPNIARLYDAGVTDAGQPYLALEYVEGKTITEHCDALKLDVRQRLDRFLQVTRAVQYAHANLVIHRDLKPSNILVTEDGQVRLLDFGIAKMLDQANGQAKETELTQIAGRALTLDYASPEQVSGRPVSTASDVYSMGVVLYQLLTGRKPYQLKRDSRGALEDAILSGEPARMSDVPRKTDADAGRGHGTTSERLAKALEGDLDTIVAKAMKKDSAQRYVTVAAFAEDIQRYLDGLPVEAQPDSWRYRAGKFAGRNRLAVAASVAVAFALAAGLGVALWQTRVATEHAQRADAEADTARRERTRADAEAAMAKRESVRADAEARLAVTAASRADEEAALAHKEANRADREALAARREARRADEETTLARRETTRGNAVQGYLVDLFSANSNDQKNAIQVRNLTAKQLLDRGAEKLEGSTDLPLDVNAALLRLFGELYETVYETDRSVQMHERSVKATERAHGKDSKPYAMALLELAWVMREQKPANPPIAMVEQAKAILARLAPDTEEYAQSLYFESSFVMLSDPTRGVRTARESLRILEASGGSRRRKAFAQRALGQAERGLGNFSGAAVALEQAASSFAALYGADAMEVGMTRTIVAECHRQELRLAEAEQIASESLEILRPYRGDRVESEIYGQRLMRLMADRGRLSAAEQRMRKAYALLETDEKRSKDAYITTAIALSDFAATRGDSAVASDVLARHRDTVASAAYITQVSFLIRIARTALALGNFPDANRALKEAKSFERTRGMPVDFSLAIASVAAEVAAAEGDGEQALAEYAAFHAKHPTLKMSLATQLSLDMSKARALVLLKRWHEADAMLATWVAKPLLPGQELPVSVKGELFLLAGEAAVGLRKPAAAKLLRDAEQVLHSVDIAGSERLIRARNAILRLGSS